MSTIEDENFRILFLIINLLTIAPNKSASAIELKLEKVITTKNIGFSTKKKSEALD